MPTPLFSIGNALVFLAPETPPRKRPLILAVMLHSVPVFLESIGLMEVWTVVKVMAGCALVASAIQWKLHFVAEFFDHVIIRLKVTHFCGYVLGTWPMAVLASVGNHMWCRFQRFIA